MKHYKVVILGPQCSGKTTLKRYLCKDASLPLIEEDELFMEMHGGSYPSDVEYKEKTLRPLLEERIRSTESMIFLTSYCSPVLLQELKSKGFKVIQLLLDREEFNRRNEKRMRKDGYEDANTWAKAVFGFHDEIRESGLIDKSIEATLPTETIAEEVLEFLSL